MQDFTKILELPEEEIRRLASENPQDERFFTAIVLKRFMEKYHLREVSTALEEFRKFKQAQGRLLSLDPTEQKALQACLSRIKPQEENGGPDTKP